MLYACIEKFDVKDSIANFLETKQGSLLFSPRAVADVRSQRDPHSLSLSPGAGGPNSQVWTGLADRSFHTGQPTPRAGTVSRTRTRRRTRGTPSGPLPRPAPHKSPRRATLCHPFPTRYAYAPTRTRLLACLLLLPSLLWPRPLCLRRCACL